MMSKEEEGKVMYRNKFYEKYKKNVYSQNGEDGVLAELLKRLGINNGWVCEFGAWDGVHLSNTFNLIEQGFRGVLIEGDKNKYQELLKTASKINALPKKRSAHVKNDKGDFVKVNFGDPMVYDRIIPIQSTIGYNEGDVLLDDVLETTDIPKDFDVLSIDVDSCDYYIWKSLQKYQPKIVVIEINSSVNPNDPNWIYTPNHSRFTTTAFRPMLNLGIEKGYTFVLHTGNMIFARNDVFSKVALASQHSLDINYSNVLENFRTNWMG